MREHSHSNQKQKRLLLAILAPHDGPCAHEQHIAVAGSLRLRGIELLQRKSGSHVARTAFRTRRRGSCESTPNAASVASPEAARREMELASGQKSMSVRCRWSSATARTRVQVLGGASTGGAAVDLTRSGSGLARWAELPLTGRSMRLFFVAKHHLYQSRAREAARSAMQGARRRR